MLTENIYNFRMDYPGLFVPQLPQPTKVDIDHSSKFQYPISPPHHPFDAASSPPRSAFTAVKSSTSGQTNQQSLELLHNLYANQLSATTFNYTNLYSTPTTSINYPPSPPNSHNSPTRPSSAAMIEQLMRRRSPAFSDDNKQVYDDHEQRLHQPLKGSMCVENSREHMARQRQEMVQRTSVIKSVIDDDRSLIRSAVQRLSSDSCGASSASSSSASSADEEIVCRWNDCFRLVNFSNIDTFL